MRCLIVIFILILSTLLPAQVDTTFSELRGMDDSSGTTHLFYRKYSYQSLSPYWIRHNDVYHFDLSTGSDTLIIEDYYSNILYNDRGPSIDDFEFWNNDPAKYIYCGAYISGDAGAYIWRYDVGVVWGWLGEVFVIEISHQNDSLLYSYHEGLLKSADGGYTWAYDSSAAEYFNLIVVSPIDDQIFFSTKDNNLFKSIDSGINYVLVDSSTNWLDFARSFLFFDNDCYHIYGIIQGNNQSHFLSSSNAGDSWNLLAASSNHMP